MQNSPVQQKERILILDVIRGVALCGILILNIGFFAFSYDNAGFNMNVLGETSYADVASWYITNFLVEGSFRALFSMLFGAGAILIISRLSKNSEGLTPADIYYRRIIWLLFFGLINAYILLWPGDILYAYAICGLFIFPLRNSSSRLLIGLALFFMFIIMFKSWLTVKERFEMREKGLAAITIKEAKKDSLSNEQKEDLQKWKTFEEKRNLEGLKKAAEKETKKIRSSYSEVWSFLKPLNEEIESTILYQSLFFDVMLFILFGMAFYKMGILTGDKPVWLYISFIIAGYSLGFGQGFYVGHMVRQTNYDFFKCYDTISPLWRLLYQPHRLLVALGHLGVIMILWKSNIFHWILKPFANVGQMAFSNYLMQSIICTLFFYGYGLGYYGKFARHELWYFVASVWVFQIIFSVLWLKFFSMGPLEWIWRSLTYWKFQSLKK